LHPSWVFWAELGVIALTGSAFLVIGYLLCRRYRGVRYAAVAIGSACLIYRVLTSTFPHRFYLDLPHFLVEGVIAPGGFFLLAAALTLAMDRSRQRVLIGVFSVVLVYYVFCDAVYRVFEGPALARLTGTWESATLRQSKSFTCGPAAAAALLRAWGIPAQEGELAYAARTSFRGTELPRLASAVREFGRLKPLTVRILSTQLDELRELDRPAILVVRKEGRPHTVTLLRAADGLFVLADPGVGTCQLDEQEFESRYAWTGRAIVAWRDPAFERRSDEPPDPTLR